MANETNRLAQKLCHKVRQTALRFQVWFCGWTICCLCRQSTAAQLCFNEPQNDVGYMEPWNKINK